jgi:hypothetical protein
MGIFAVSCNGSASASPATVWLAQELGFNNLSFTARSNFSSNVSAKWIPTVWVNVTSYLTGCCSSGKFVGRAHEYVTAAVIVSDKTTGVVVASAYNQFFKEHSRSIGGTTGTPSFWNGKPVRAEISNPVSFTKGHAYVVESFLEVDLACPATGVHKGSWQSETFESKSKGTFLWAVVIP